MTYSYSDMLAASETLEHGYRRTTLVLEPGDVAPSCVSTKYDLRAGAHGATVVYLIHPSGIEVRVVAGSVGRAYHEDAA